MSTTVTLNGVNYEIPAYNDKGWAQGTGNLSSYLIAVATAINGGGGGGGQAVIDIVAVTGTSQAVTTGKTYLVTTASNAVSLTLPTPAVNNWFWVKDVSANAAVHNITVVRHGTEKINGVAANKVLSISAGEWLFACDGTDWYMLRDAENFNPLKSSNQLTFTPGSFSTTLNVTAPSANRTLTVPDPGAAAKVVLSEGVTGLGFTENLLYANSTTANGFGSAGRIGFGTSTPLFKYHFYADGDPLLYQLTYAGDFFDTGTGLPKGYLGPLANNIWWDKSAGVAAAAGDAGFLGTIIFNTSLGGGLVTHQEMAEIGVVVVDGTDATRTARMQFELNSNGNSFQTVIGKSLGGAFMTLDPILNNGATLKVGPGESIVSVAPINGGAYISSDDYSNALYCAGAQYMGANVFTARGTDPIVLDLGAATAHKFRVCTDASQTKGNTYTPTERFSITTTGIAAALPLDMGSNKITGLADGTTSTDAVNKGQLDAAVAGGIPPGVIFPYGGSSAPTGYLLCDGSAVSRSTYAALFAVIGTAFGVGNGTTTFNVPTQTDKVPMGAGANAVGANVGSATHTHAIPHKHETPIWRRTSDGSLIVPPTAPYGTGTTVSDATGGGGFTAGAANNPNTTYLTNGTDTANSASASSLQPAFVTNFIIKT